MSPINVFLESSEGCEIRIFVNIKIGARSLYLSVNVFSAENKDTTAKATRMSRKGSRGVARLQNKTRQVSSAEGASR